ncbi:hypothetical protein D187_004842 [Cystobacter fuscus DSM 2262]|uniref:Uncharacterized protein n=1 Tax=Cystobacter fuscus (strain ATCC 25194 / DSM 2262 / NBRC 100088 / M29) TaxID=1242864 RepID=S9P5W1_CYSF2|nr:hypothetical protein D187_004842 [Cystobacter fuscus DSM 2262]
MIAAQDVAYLQLRLLNRGTAGSGVARASGEYSTWDEVVAAHERTKLATESVPGNPYVNSAVRWATFAHQRCPRVAPGWPGV